MSESSEVKQEETIAAISTPSGEGAIGMVRLSGDTAIQVLTQMFRSPSGKPRENFESHKVYYGFVVDENERKIDETIVTAMISPRTFTKEDVVEVSGHGGEVAVKRVLQRALSLGARLAEPGEFSKRAFLNGRIDLVQAEAIIDLIKSKSDKGYKTAFSQLDGKLSQELENIEIDLIDINAIIEASIDFPDEELEIAKDDVLEEKLQQLKYKICKLSDTYGFGRIYREGIGVVIIGRPNVGKSSLMNSLLERDRVIVTETPGTTRDTVEETLQLEGVAVRIVDTAGVREADEAAEKLGVERAIGAARDADIVLLTLDGSEPLTTEDFNLMEKFCDEDEVAGPVLITLMNKADKPLRLEQDQAEKKVGAMISPVSAKFGEGIDELRARISAEMEKMGERIYDGPVLTRERHLERLKEMAESVGRALTTLNDGMSREFVAADLQDAKKSLEELTGKAVDDQVLEKIFSEFCIGK